MNESELHLYTDFVVFKTEAEHIITACRRSRPQNPIIEGNVKYGKFPDDAFRVIQGLLQIQRWNNMAKWWNLESGGFGSTRAQSCPRSSPVDRLLPT